MKNRKLFLALAIGAVVAAIWSAMLLGSPQQPTLDQRVADVASQLKCPICQGESVQDSSSELAQQMRGVIRQQLQSGRSEQQVIQYFVDRYGEQIVLAPRRQGFTLLAWLAPLVLLLTGAVLLFFVLRDWRPGRPSPDENTPGNALEQGYADESELAGYRAQLEQELAAADPLFDGYGTGAR
ncbi:MAG: cytochrome c-type biogenesis protein CcmH [Ktedonobacteraceae bacterium]|nr:cytochrome c-type biogenesis protein CcmH [Ktedonobacteraceae bacterium]